VATNALAWLNAIKVDGVNGNEADPCYEARILFHGLRDLANIARITSVPKWDRHPIAVEEVWCLAIDAEERVAATALALRDEYREWLKGIAAAAMQAIIARYGDGPYLSVGLSAEKYLCTVCGEDYRGCSHERGIWYDGVLCRRRMIGVKRRETSVVDNPKDRRCRIWPWNTEKSSEPGESMRFVARCMSMFELAGNDGETGKVVNLAELFSKPTQSIRAASDR